MRQLFHILKFKLIAFIRLDYKITVINIFINAAGSLIYLAFAAGGFFFVQKLFHFLLVEIRVGLFLLHEFISMLLFIFFITVNLGNIIVSYSTLYKSSEVNYLLTRPIMPLKIFAIKFLDNFFYSSSTLIMILFSLLAGYVFYFKLSLGAFLILVINFVPFIVSAGSLGVIIMLGLIKLANRFGVKKIIYSLITAYILLIIFYFRTYSPKLLVDSVLNFYPYTAMKDDYLGELIQTLLQYLPNYWLSQSGYWMVRGDIYNSFYYFFLQMTICVTIFSMAMYLGHRWYFSTWLMNQIITSDLSFYRTERKQFFRLGINSFFNGQPEAIIKRDITIFIREPSQVIHSIILLFLIVVFLVSVSGIKFIGLGNIYLQTMIYIAIFLFNLLFITTLSLRFIFPLISLEGQTFWKVKSSPVSNTSLIKHKLLIPTLVIVVVSLTLSFFSNYKFGIVLTFFSMAATFSSAIAVMSINFGMGGLYANYREKNPVRLSSSQGASLSFLLNILFMLFLVIVLFQPLSKLFLSIMIKKPFEMNVFYWSLIPIYAVSIILSILFLKIAANSIRKDI